VYRYSVYGLNIASDIELPELYSLEFESADVRIRLGTVPRSLLSPDIRTDWIDLGQNSCLVRVPRVGRFLIEDGESITIEVAHLSDGPDPLIDLRSYVLGSALGALLHQRGSLPLHIAAVMTAHGVVGFTGPSGAGKSTLGGWFMKRFERPLFSDDVAALNFPEDSLRLFAGPRRIKLGRDAIDHLGFDTRSASRLASKNSKYQVLVEQPVLPEPNPLIALVELARHNVPEHPALERLQGKDAFDVIMGAVYRPIMGDWFQKHDRMVRLIASLCDSIEVYRFTRSWSLDRLSADLEFLADRIEAIPANSAFPLKRNAVTVDG